MQVLAIPVKALDRAKTRLASVLTAPERARLTMAMLDDVMDAATAQVGWDLWVLSSDPVVLGSALGRGARPRRDRAGSLLGAVREAEASLGADDTLAVLLADLPLLDAAALRRALAAAAGWAAAAAPAASDGGTNLLLRRPPGVIRARFGRDSFARHRSEAERAGLTLREIAEPALAFDLDRPSDLAKVLAGGRPSRTLDVCGSLGLSGRLRQPALSRDG